MDRPIGYWLKHLDNLIEAALDDTLAAEGMTRRQWQTMNLLHHAPHDDAGLAEALRPFGGADEAFLARREWVARDGTGWYALTPAGRAAHATVQDRVRAGRATIMTGLSDDDYRSTVRVLRRMAENLESPEVTAGRCAPR